MPDSRLLMTSSLSTVPKHLSVVADSRSRLKPLRSYVSKYAWCLYCGSRRQAPWDVYSSPTVQIQSKVWQIEMYTLSEYMHDPSHTINQTVKLAPHPPPPAPPVHFMAVRTMKASGPFAKARQINRGNGTRRRAPARRLSLSGLCWSGVGLNVTRSPESGRIGRFQLSLLSWPL